LAGCSPAPNPFSASSPTGYVNGFRWNTCPSWRDLPSAPNENCRSTVFSPESRRDSGAIVQPTGAVIFFQQ
jgi:hypothetical protein